MKYVTTVNGKRFEIDIQRDGTLLVNGESRTVDFLAIGPSMYSILMENVSHELVIERRDEGIEVLMRGRLYEARVLDERAQLMAERSGIAPDASGEVTIKSPMPGLVVAVTVQEGETVKAGQTVIILESMKMQNELKASRDATIQRIHVTAGQSVEQNKPLITLG
jgi:biotin carboxyl carrier protein